MSLNNSETAEEMFRDAFERLKINKPLFIDKGSKITQNNIAREAGRDPSALKKSRYPLLVLEIQAYINSIECDSLKVKKTKDARVRSLKDRMSDCRKQRDKLASIVEAQNFYIEELLDDIERLKLENVVQLK
ncbi:hypothetical protein [Marinomonas sp.]